MYIQKKKFRTHKLCYENVVLISRIAADGFDK